MIRYFYYLALEISDEPLSADRLHFLHQPLLITTVHDVEPLRELTLKHIQDTCDPPENAEISIAALREAGGDSRIPPPTPAEAEDSVNKSVRLLLHLKIVRYLPVFMIRESFRSLMEERPDILLLVLPYIQPGYVRAQFARAASR